MTHTIYSNLTASISELKKDPMGTINSSYGEPLAILNRNEPVFYCIPARTYESMVEAIEDPPRGIVVQGMWGHGLA